jgi:hypothetical protein
MAEDANERAFRTALSLLTAGSLNTPSDLERAADAAIDFVSNGATDCPIDRENLLRRLWGALNIYQREGFDLNDDKDSGHVPWIEGRKSEINWAFTERYLRYLREREARAPAVLDRLDRTTLKILGHLGDPDRLEPWDRRGLVVGGIQSGKTENILGVICRAADAGYRLIVVLAGLTNDLRSQTQLRVDKGFVGIDTLLRIGIETDDSGGESAFAIGVRSLPGAPKLAVASLTRSSPDGDFLTDRAKAHPFPIGVFPVVFVVKKHAILPKKSETSDGKKIFPSGILFNLKHWILETAGEVPVEGGPRRVRDFPLLVIDDEADNASINVKYAGAESSLSEITPTSVNAGIRSLLQAFDRKAYIGYTATPNANIFIPHDVEHEEYGPDLFPKNFIEYIIPPSNYFGPAKIFGAEDFEDDTDTESLDSDSTDSKSPRGLIRTVKDYKDWLPDKHKKGTRPGKLPHSLREAIQSFVLARAVRLARGQQNEHNSMLIHVTRFQAVQNLVYEQVRDELDELRGRIRFGDGDGSDVRAELETLFKNDFVPVMETWQPTEPVEPVTWSDVEPQLEAAVSPIVVKVIHGNSDDALAYHEHRHEGLNVIAVGGTKLSRGLTLDGLSVSYYLRAAGNHDTLLQMGRWFGYRDGYEDVCRLYTTAPLVEAFRGVTEANLELIAELEEMAQRNERPLDYGLKVRDSVPGMLVTARNKMPLGESLRIGFSAQGPSTVVMYCDRDRAGNNLKTTVDLLESFRDRGYEQQGETGETQVWKGVDGLLLASEFFERYESPAAAWRVQGSAIAGYVKDRVEAGELTDWTVALLSSKDADVRMPIGDLSVGLTKRAVLSGLEDRLGDGLYSIKQLLSPRHEWMDLTEAEYKLALDKTIKAYERDPGRFKRAPKIPSGTAIRDTRSREKGLLLIYPLSIPEVAEGADITSEPIIGFFVSFPKSPGAPQVDYVVNKIFLDEFYGPDEPDEEA